MCKPWMHKVYVNLVIFEEETAFTVGLYKHMAGSGLVTFQAQTAWLVWEKTGDAWFEMGWKLVAVNILSKVINITVHLNQVN